MLITNRKRKKKHRKPILKLDPETRVSRAYRARTRIRDVITEIEAEAAQDGKNIEWAINRELEVIREDRAMQLERRGLFGTGKGPYFNWLRDKAIQDVLRRYGILQPLIELIDKQTRNVNKTRFVEMAHINFEVFPNKFKKIIPRHVDHRNIYGKKTFHSLFLADSHWYKTTATTLNVSIPTLRKYMGGLVKIGFLKLKRKGNEYYYYDGYYMYFEANDKIRKYSFFKGETMRKALPNFSY